MMLFPALLISDTQKIMTDAEMESVFNTALNTPGLKKKNSSQTGGACNYAYQTGSCKWFKGKFKIVHTLIMLFEVDVFILIKNWYIIINIVSVFGFYFSVFVIGV